MRKQELERLLERAVAEAIGVEVKAQRRRAAAKLPPYIAKQKPAGSLHDGAAA